MQFALAFSLYTHGGGAQNLKQWGAAVTYHLPVERDNRVQGQQSAVSYLIPMGSAFACSCCRSLDDISSSFCYGIQSHGRMTGSLQGEN